MSLVWNVFTKSECGYRATCEICFKSFSNSGSNTTNLWNHLKKSHKGKFHELDKQKRGIQNCELGHSDLLDILTSSGSSQDTDLLNMSNSSSSLTIPSGIICNSEDGSCSTPTEKKKLHTKQTSMTSFTLTPSNKLKFDKILAYFVAVDMMPYNIVEKEGFKAYTRALNPSYRLPSRSTLTNKRIPDLYNETKLRVQNVVSTTTFWSLTTDCWTSVSNKPFLALTCHFLDKQFNLVSICLSCQELSESHTGENLASAIQFQLLEYNCDVDASIGAITTDHGANVLKAVENLKIPHIPCFGHSFNTAVKKIFELDEVIDAINNVKAIQNIFAYSWKAVKEMSIEQQRYCLKTVKFPSYSKTRWWSLLDLIEVVLSQELPLASFLRTHNKGAYKDRMLNEHQIEILKTVISTLSPIRKISDNLAGESYVTASAILPVVNMIQNNLSEAYQLASREENSVCLVLKRRMLETIMTVLRKRYGNNIILKMCTALDPRFKLDRIDIENTSIDLVAFKETLKEECVRTWQYSVSKSEASLDSPPKKSKSTGLSAIFDTSYDLQSTQSTYTELSFSDKVEHEIDAYFNLPKIDYEQNPVTWWHLNGTMFPFLKVMANKLMSIQATSVASERVFSRAGNIVSDQRASLTEDHCSQLIYLSMNKNFVPNPFNF